MKFSLRFIVGFVVTLLVLASAVSLYFALKQQYTSPLFLVAISNIGAVIILVFLITRGIASPLEKIRQIMQKVGEGDFKVRIEPLPTQEMRELGVELNKMITNLQRAKEREQEVDRLKTEFLSLAAHQLRSPLVEIKWALQSLLDGDVGSLSQAQKETIEKAYSSNENMLNLVTDLLDITRIEEGKYLFQLTLVHIEDIASEVVKSFAKEAMRKNIDLILLPPKERSPEVLVDEEKIRLAIENLVENALHYTPGGGKVTVSFGYGKKEVELRVSDTGIGIPKAEQGRIFERFFRASNVQKLNPKGTGLGLHLTRNIVQAHGGTINFFSQENKGSTFSICLPIAQQ